MTYGDVAELLPESMSLTPQRVGQIIRSVNDDDTGEERKQV